MAAPAGWLCPVTNTGSATTNGITSIAVTAGGTGYSSATASVNRVRSLALDALRALPAAQLMQLADALISLDIVRINAVVFVDYLIYHRIDGDWLITSKAYHVERSDPPKN